MNQLGFDAKTAASLENPHTAIAVSPSNSRQVYMRRFNVNVVLKTISTLTNMIMLKNYLVFSAS